MSSCSVKYNWAKINKRKEVNNLRTKLEKLQDEFFRCSICNELHDAVFVINDCCEDAPVEVLVVKDDSVILQCAECGSEITRFKFSANKKLKK